MTEAEWLVCEDPQPMLAFLEGRISDRKRRLFAVACCRLVRFAWGDERIPEGFEALEAHAEDGGTHEVWEPVSGRVYLAVTVNPGPATSAVLTAVMACENGRADYNCVEVAEEVAEAFGDRGKVGKVKRVRRRQARMLREIIGSPFRPVMFLPEWRTDTVLSLAKAMYDSRDFAAMPILADALGDAGCEDEVILGHCRGSTPHARGCHVVDALLGRS